MKLLPYFTVIPLSIALISCDGSSDSKTEEKAHPWKKNIFQSETLFKNKCASPRPKSVINPYTNKAYPDTAGTVMDEQLWVRSWNDNVYLWYDEGVDQNPIAFKNAPTYFSKTLKTTQRTNSGTLKDQFSYSTSTEKYNKLFQSGVKSGYGVNWIIKSSPSTGDRGLYVKYSEPDSPAEKQDLLRGARIIEVDGINLTTFSTAAQRTIINNGITPATVGETHQFKFLPVGSSSPRSISLTSENVTIQPVQKTTLLSNSQSGEKMAYLLFNTHISTARDQLIKSFAYFKKSSVNGLVIDMRYNGGGLVTVANLLASLVSGNSSTQGQSNYFLKKVMNDKHKKIDPFTGKAIQKQPFYTSYNGTPLPRLDLNRVYILSGANTCSASELVINSLRGVGIEVILIGETSCGKPYAFYPTDNCGISYSTINFKGVNAQSFGDYSDGFTPANGSGSRDIGVRITGCVAPDDLSHELSDPKETRLLTALNYHDTGSCIDYSQTELRARKTTSNHLINQLNIQTDPEWQNSALLTPNNLGLE